jgi:hypothetical protein
MKLKKKAARAQQRAVDPLMNERNCYAILYRDIFRDLRAEVIRYFFNLPNPSSRTMAVGSTQLLTEMSTRNLPVGERVAGA